MKIKTLFFCLLFLLYSTPGANAQSQIAMIVNVNNPVKNLTIQELKQIYLGRATAFPDGEKVQTVEYSPLKNKFYKVVLNMSDRKFKKHWISMVFSGRSATPPKQFQDENELKTFVSKTPSAIAFINLSKVDKSVKVLAVDGKKPGDKNYGLK